MVTTPVAIGAGDHVAVTIIGDLTGNGITLPAGAGAHPVTVATSVDTALTGSYTLAATLPITVLSATPSPATPDAPATYTITFTTSAHGSLADHRGVITIYLPGTSGACPAWTVTDLTTGQTGHVTCAYPAAATPIAINAGDHIQITITGLTTPTAPGPQPAIVLTTTDTFATTTYALTSPTTARPATAMITRPAVHGRWRHTYLWQSCLTPTACPTLHGVARRAYTHAGSRIGDATTTGRPASHRRRSGSRLRASRVLGARVTQVRAVARRPDSARRSLRSTKSMIAGTPSSR